MNILYIYWFGGKRWCNRWVSGDYRISISISVPHEVPLTEAVERMATSRDTPANLIAAALIMLQRYIDRLKENLREEQEAEPSPDVPGPDPLIPAPRRPMPVPPLARVPIPEPVGERHKRRIPQDVKIAVSARDGGRCRQCGSVQQLHFDHVIPVSRGGANTVANIQLLCGPCNRAKAAKITRDPRRLPAAVTPGRPGRHRDVRRLDRGRRDDAPSRSLLAGPRTA